MLIIIEDKYSENVFYCHRKINWITKRFFKTNLKNIYLFSLKIDK